MRRVPIIPRSACGTGSLPLIKLQLYGGGRRGRKGQKKTPLKISLTQFSTATAWRVLAAGAMASSYRRGIIGPVYYIC